MKNRNTLLIILVVTIAILPFILNPAGKYNGADNEAGDLINVLDPDYEPWLTSIWEPPSGEIESLLFSLQAALGSGFVFYFLGYAVGKKKGLEDLKNADNR